MRRAILQTTRALIALAMFFVLALSLLYFVSAPDLITDTEIQQAFPPTFGGFENKAHRDLMIEGLVVAVFIVGLLFTFRKISSVLKENEQKSKIRN